jgi:hypothetical protein
MSDQPPPALESLQPGRLLAEQAAGILGFKKHDIPILVKAKLLKPLGNPARHAVKYFAACQVGRLACDEEWLNRASKAVYRYWDTQNQKRRKKPNCLNANLPMAV